MKLKYSVVYSNRNICVLKNSKKTKEMDALSIIYQKRKRIQFFRRTSLLFFVLNRSLIILICSKRTHACRSVKKKGRGRLESLLQVIMCSYSNGRTVKGTPIKLPVAINLYKAPGSSLHYKCMDAFRLMERMDPPRDPPPSPSLTHSPLPHHQAPPTVLRSHAD